MKRLGSFLLMTALLAPMTAHAMNFVVSRSDVHPRPQVIGDLVAISPTVMVVASTDGRVPLMMDSRTLVPTDLTVGNTVAVDFRVLDNGNYYATRVVPFRGAVPAFNESATSAYDARDESSEPVPVTEVHTTSTHAPAASEPIAQNEAPAETYASSSADRTHQATTTSTGGELPRTASARPLLGLAGILTLAAASTMVLIRRSRLA